MMLSPKHQGLLLVTILCFVLAGCSDSENHAFQGYIEGEYLYLAAPQAGYLKSLDIQRGTRVSAGQTIFVVNEQRGQVLHFAIIKLKTTTGS